MTCPKASKREIEKWERIAETANGELKEEEGRALQE